MCGGGTSQTSTVSIPPEVLANYQKVFGMGEQIASKPFQEYSKDPNAFVAGMTPTQQAAMQNINAVQGMASGDVAAGQQMIGAGTGQGNQLQQASLGTAAEGQGIGSQLYGKSMGTSEAGLGAAGQIYGQAMPQISQATALGQRYGQDAAQNLYSGISQAQPYMGEASNLTRAGLGAGQQYANLAGGYLGAGTQNVGVGDLNTEKYMSPYINQVVKAQQALQAQENETQRSALKGDAIRAGAFGGDRAGVAQANLARQQSMANQATLANTLQQGFSQAQGVAGQQQQLGLSADQANRAAQQFGAQQAAALGQQQFGQSLSAAQQQAAIGQALYGQNIGQGQAIAGLGQQLYGQGLGSAQATAGMGKDIYGMSAQQAQLQQAAAQGMFGQAAQVAALQQGAGNNMFNYGLQGGQGIANLGLANQQAQLAAAQAQMQAGQIQQQTDQAGKTALYNQFTQQQGFPYQQVQFLGNLAMGTGALSGSTTTTTGSSGGIFSDRRLKENVEKVGETFEGQPIYRYNYKGEKATQIGLMADESDKKAVGHSQGYKTLDYKKATEKAAKRGHFYEGGLVPASMGGAVGTENAYEAYSRGGYAEGGWTKTADERDSGGTLTPAQWTNASGEVKYGSDPNVAEDAAAAKAKDISGVDPRINEIYQESMFRDVNPEEAKKWQAQLDKGASFADVKSKIENSRERQLVNQTPLTYDASKFQEAAAPVMNRYGAASAPMGSYAASFQPQQNTAPAQYGGYGQQMSQYGYGPQYGYGQQMGYGQPQASGKGVSGGNYSQPTQSGYFNQGYGGGYQAAPQASGKGVGPSSYQSNYGYSNPSSMGATAPQASGKGPSTGSSTPSTGTAAAAPKLQRGGRAGYLAGGMVDPNDLAALAAQRLAQLAPHAAGMPGQTLPGAQSGIPNKLMHVPKLITSSAQLPAQKNPFDQAVSMADKVNSLSKITDKGNLLGEDSFVRKTLDKGIGLLPQGAQDTIDSVTGKTIRSGSGAGAAGATAAPAPSVVGKGASLDGAAVDPAAIKTELAFADGLSPDNIPVEDLERLLTAHGGSVHGYERGGLVPGYALGGSTLPYGGGESGGGYIPEEVLEQQKIQGLPRDNEQLKAAGAKATAGGSSGLGDVMKLGNLGYKLAPESLKAGIKSLLPGAETAAPAAAEGLGAAAPAAAEAASGLGAAAGAGEAAAGLGAAAGAGEAAAGLGALAGAGEAAAGLGAAAGAGEAIAGLGSLAAAGGEGLTALLAFLPFLSDRRAKENIEPVGKTYDGQTIYRYNYKGDKATQIGLIAQEVEKKHKDAVGSSNGMKTVDYKRATEDAADRGHFYNGGLIPYRRGYADGMVVDEADLPAIGAQDTALPVGRMSDEEYAIRTIAAEMGGRSPEEARGIAAVIENRLKSGRWGEGYKDVVTARNQFEPWNKPEGPNYPMRFAADSPRMQMARAAFEGRGEDPTGGALHFYAPAAQAILAQTKGDRAAVPSWARGKDAVDIATTRFVRDVDGAPRPPREIPNEAPTEPRTAASQAVALAKQPSAPEKKDSGSFPIRPPDSAKGKEQDWSDFLTSKQFILPALTAIGTMGTTPTRSLGTALSAGLLGGITSYQGLDKLAQEQEMKGREVTVQEKSVDLQDVARRQARLTQLQQIAAGQARATGKVSPEVQQQIDELVKSLNITSSTQKISEAGKPAPTTTTGKVTEAKPEPGITQEPAKAATETVPLSGTEKARALAEEAAKPIPTPSNPMEDKTFLSKLNPDSNPEEIRRRGQLAEAYSPGAAEKAFAEALEVEKRMQDRGYGIGPDGKQVDIPGWFEHKQAMENAPEVRKFFNAQGTGQIARIEAREQLGGITRALEILQSGKFAQQKGEFQAALKSAGFPVPNTATMNAEAAEVATKDAMRAVFSRLAEIGGQPRVVEIQGLIQSGANVGLQPEANRKIISQSLASLDRADKFFADALEERNRLGYKFNEPEFAAKWSKKEENASEKFREEAYKNTAIRGATPTLSNGTINFSEVKDGHTYMIEPDMLPGVTRPTKYRVVRDKDGKRGFEEVR